MEGLCFGQGVRSATRTKRRLRIMNKDSRSKYQFYQEASLSQKLSDKIPNLAKLSGTDQEISDSIAVLTYLNDPETFTDTKTGK